MSNNKLLNVMFISMLTFFLLGVSVEPACAQNKLVIQADLGRETIDKNIYGHFSEHLGRCIYEGYWVGEDSPIPNTRGIRNDVVKALKKIKVPVLRWPGGCFADEYHWKDGIGPREERPSMINTHWGGVTENNHFGTHEFLDLCEQIGCEPFITGNVGSGTVQELSEWVEYVNFDGVSPMANLRRKNGREEPWRVKYWGVGNENWGCGGQMRPEYYADLYRRFQTYVRSYPGARPFKVACGPYGEDTEWMEELMKSAEAEGVQMDGIDLHYYSWSGKNSKSATRFEEIDWFHLLRDAARLNEILKKQSNIMDKYDPEKRVALIVGEWGAWHEVEQGTKPGFLYQQNSLRDALVASVSLNIMNQHCDRVRMGNIAQTVNVLQAMILTDGPKMILTPSYHVFDLFKVHQDATLLPITLECEDYRFDKEEMPGLNVSASRDKSGKIHISICNLNPNEEAELSCEIRGARTGKISAQILTAPEITSHNTFDDPEVVKPSNFSEYRKTENGFKTTLPAKSIVVLEIEGFDRIDVDDYEARVYTSSKGDTIPYRLFVPRSYDRDKKYPLVLFHHGAGGSGNDNKRQFEGPLPRKWAGPERQAKNPCFIILPQIPRNRSRDRENRFPQTEVMCKHIQTIHEILDNLEEEFSIDTNREYVTGFSMGGECTWMSINEQPERFAAAVPICAGDKFIGMEPSEMGQKFAHFPLWIFHGDADEVISVDVSRRLVKALRHAGGAPKYTEYPGVDHGSWELAYRERELIEWLFAQSREP